MNIPDNLKDKCIIIATRGVTVELTSLGIESYWVNDLEEFKLKLETILPGVYL